MNLPSSTPMQTQYKRSPRALWLSEYFLFFWSGSSMTPCSHNSSRFKRAQTSHSHVLSAVHDIPMQEPWYHSEQVLHWIIYWLASLAVISPNFPLIHTLSISISLEVLEQLVVVLTIVRASSSLLKSVSDELKRLLLTLLLWSSKKGGPAASSWCLESISPPPPPTWYWSVSFCITFKRSFWLLLLSLLMWVIANSAPSPSCVGEISPSEIKRKSTFSSTPTLPKLSLCRSLKMVFRSSSCCVVSFLKQIRETAGEYFCWGVFYNGSLCSGGRLQGRGNVPARRT